MKSDSTASKIAATGSRLARLRVPEGAQVQTYQAPKTGGPRDSQPPAITAAAQLLSRQTVDRSVKKPSTERWQNDAWDLRDEIGELRFIGDRQARGVSQVRLFVGKATGDDATPKPVVDDPIAKDLQTLLFGSKAATEQFLYRAAQQLIFNGESIIHCKQDGQRIATYARSVQELQGRPGAWEFTDGAGTAAEKVDDDSEIVIRCWRPEPKFYGKADAPVRAILPVARELRGLTMFVSAQIDSRLAGAGLLLVPDQIESAWQRRQEVDDVDYADRTTIEEELTEYFLTPIKDRDSAAAVVPFILSMDAELVDKIKHVTFSSPLDEHAAELRDESIRRIGLGMDSDPSILLGQGSGSHWSAWAIDANEIRFGVEPVASIICHSLTVGLLRPLMEQQGVDDPDEWQVWFDTADLVVRDDRSKDAQALFDKDVIGKDTLLAENGFSDADQPDATELEQARLWKILQMRPDLIDEKTLAKLGIDIGPVAPAPSAEPAPGTPVPGQPAPGQSAPVPAAKPKAIGQGVAAEAADGPPVMGQTKATKETE